VVFLLLGVVIIMTLDSYKPLSYVMIALGIFTILRSLKEQEPEDERSKRLRDRALANSWILTAVFISAVFIISEAMGFESGDAILILLLLLVMLSSAAVFRVYYERRGDIDL